jgi:hypothetical protein
MLTEFLKLKELTVDELLALPPLQQAAFFNAFADYRLQMLRKREENALRVLSNVRCAIALNETLRRNDDSPIEYSA